MPQPTEPVGSVAAPGTIASTGLCPALPGNGGDRSHDTAGDAPSGPVLPATGGTLTATVLAAAAALLIGSAFIVASRFRRRPDPRR